MLRSLARASTIMDLPAGLSASLDMRRKKLLRWATQRGMLENDLILGTYAIDNIKTMSDNELDQFEAILLEPDPDIFQWITKKKPLPEEMEGSTVMLALQAHSLTNPLKYKQ